MSKRVTSILALTLATAGMFFIGSQAMAQQIFACVNNSSGTIHIVAQNSACQSNEILLNWNVVGPQGPAGPAGATGATGATGPQGPAGTALGAANFFCPHGPFTYSPGAPIPGAAFTAGVSFGSPVSYDGTTFFLANAGIYQVHFNAGNAILSEESIIVVDMFINGVLNNWTWQATANPGFAVGELAGDVLIQVPANTTVQILNAGLSLILNSALTRPPLPPVIPGIPASPACGIIFTRLQ
jgi:hypothetical protein